MKKERKTENTNPFPASSAEGREALERRNEGLDVFILLLIVEDDRAAAAEAELPRGEVNDIHRIRDRADDLADGLVFIGFLTGFDEMQVILQQARVEDRAHAVLFAEPGNGEHVGKGDGLAADQVRAGFDADKGDLPAMLPEDTLELLEIEIALEQLLALLIEALLLQADHVISAAVFDFSDGGSELEVHRNDGAGIRLHISEREHVFAGPALVNGKEIILVEYQMKYS